MDLEEPGPMFFWSRGHSYGRLAYKIKVVWDLPTSYLVRLGTLGPGGALWGSAASAMHFGGNFITQKLLGTPQL